MEVFARAMWSLLKKSFSEWNDDNAPRMGASLAFYSMLSLAPLLIVALAVAGAVLDRKAAQTYLVDQVQAMVGSDGAQVIQTVLENAREPETGALATIFGVLTLLFGASGVFVELRDALNRAWEVKARQVSGVVALIRDRVLSFGMVLAVGFLLLVSLVVSAALAAAGKFVEGILPLPEFVLQGVNFLTSIAVITLLFAMIYRFVPDVKIAWRDVWLGAGMTALLFTVGKFAIGMYLGKAGVGSAYGAAGALVVFLVWVYYSAQIFFFGAEFTQVYAHSRGSRASGESPEPAPRQAGDAAAEPPAVPLGFPIPAAPQPPTVALATAGPGVRYGVPAVWLAAMLAAGWLNKKIGRTGR